MSSDSSSRAQSDEEISHSSSEEEVPPAPTGWDVAGFANNPINNYISRYIQSEIARMQQPPPQRPIRRRRRYIPRNHTGAHDRLFADYFAEEPRYPADVFRRRFRMRRSLFLRIVNALSARYPEFRLQRDAAGKPGLSPLQKCTVAIRQLAYGGSADMFDEYLQCGETTGNECLKNFCQGVREIFGEHYLRSPDAADCQFLLDWHWRTHGFPGMLGSIDCMHWQWKNCPTAWRGQFTTGYKGTHPTIILEAVADQRLWIWHAYFGIAGSNNDLNVLNSSPLFNERINGLGPSIEFTANGNVHNMGYYLADGIYPQWPVFLKTIRCPLGDRRRYFARAQESARKDVERAFGVLQSRFALVKGPTRFFYQGDIADIMYACIIMHNMIIDDEHEGVLDVTNDPSVASSSHGVSTESARQGVPHNEHERFQAFMDIHQKEAHQALQHDIIEELWANRNRAHRP
ncbi:putative nuclease HARBI1 [Salvia hispanica]|uniref:putative nuclease HARBI1 n=1 Tax=Salvia hispanica TaxID=49212 RepID=UPI0020098CB3|nr:putative nuclease HARBI1 [Salvia hispanica]